MFQSFAACVAFQISCLRHSIWLCVNLCKLIQTNATEKMS